MISLPPNQRDLRRARRVRLLKLALPLLSLAIMSSLFLFSRGITMDGALPFAEIDIEDRLREPKVTQVQIATTAENGAVIDLAADAITPAADMSGATARGAHGTITALTGKVTTLSAPLVAYDERRAAAALTGGVEMTSGGYVMTTDGLDVALTDARLDSRGAVVAKGLLGDLDAGRMSVTQTSGGFVLVFKSGVRLLYKPQK